MTSNDDGSVILTPEEARALTALFASPVFVGTTVCRSPAFAEAVGILLALRDHARAHGLLPAGAPVCPTCGGRGTQRI